MPLRKPEDKYEVYQIMLATNPHGKNHKAIAMEVRPDLNAEQAKSWLSKVISQHGDRVMKPDEELRFIEVCGNPEVLLAFLCEKFRFYEPIKKVLPLPPEKELKIYKKVLEDNGIEVNLEDYIDQNKELISLDIKKKGDD